MVGCRLVYRQCQNISGHKKALHFMCVRVCVYFIFNFFFLVTQNASQSKSFNGKKTLVLQMFEELI